MDNNKPMVSPNEPQGQQFPPLVGQESLYNLTFDEVHDQLGHVGKPLNSMVNFDQLRNAIPVDETQLVQNPPSSSSSSSSAPFFLGNFNLNSVSSKKTVDEAWKEIANEERVNGLDNQSLSQQHGETTLEDFLVHAGVINAGHQNQVMEIDPMVVLPRHAELIQQQQEMMTVLDSNFHASGAVYDNSVMNVGYSDNQQVMTMAMPVSEMSATSSESQAAAEKKRRCSDEMMEKTIERRQKRMIKNRESAARSRARKQAYTNKLEHGVFLSRKTNNCLKKQKEVEILLSSDLTPMPRYQLRRTSSASF